VPPPTPEAVEELLKARTHGFGHGKDPMKESQTAFLLCSGVFLILATLYLSYRSYCHDPKKRERLAEEAHAQAA
jgi:hypothetical protein